MWAPQSPIAYYQQVGRAGRGVERAEVLLLPGEEDEAIWRYFASLAFPDEAQVRRTLEVLSASSKPLSTPALEAHVDLRRTRLETMLKVLDVDGAVRRVSGGWVATGEDWAYDAARYARVSADRAAEQQAMRDYASTEGCRMEFLRRTLDDPAARPCGRCDRCTGEGWPTTVSAEALAGAQARLDRPGVDVAPRRNWPIGMAALGIGLSGRIPPERTAETGRALGRLSDVGWGGRLRQVFGPSALDGPVPADVMQAVVRLLAAWDWELRPAGVVSVASRRRPLLVESLAPRIAELGRLPILGRVERTRDDRSASGRSNSAQRLRAVHGAFAVPPSLADAIQAIDEAPMLLVDDRTDTGWTVTEVTALLRAAGAGPVLPLVLAVES